MATNIIFGAAIELVAQDWPTLYENNYELMLAERKRQREMDEKMETKQRQYICREQEYRNVIKSLKEHIDRIS